MALGHLAAAAAGISLWTLPAPATRVDGNAPFISTWLVAGAFDNRGGKAIDEHPFDVKSARPRPGATVAGGKWIVFDDRCFSRNYDDYVDLFSYERAIRNRPAAGVAFYAATWVWSPTATSAHLRVGADSMFRAWWNGSPVGRSDVGNPKRVTAPPPQPQGFPDSWFRIQCDNAGKDLADMPVQVHKGWNLLVLKVANRAEGLLGFYARICDGSGDAVPGLVTALAADGPLAIALPGMPGVSQHTPTAFRDWPFCAMDHPWVRKMISRTPEARQRWDLVPQASAFRLGAAGGTPPYRWKLTGGSLPAGLTLQPDGTITGTVAAGARVGTRVATLLVADAAGHSAGSQLTIPVVERPNRWYEEARLHGLIHAPEGFKPTDWPSLARLMKRQGYTTGFPISYGNGDWVFRWPSRFEPNAEYAGTLDRVSSALRAEGLKFGIYIGNTFAAPQFSYEQVILMLEDACRRYKPDAFWFDWLAIDHSSLDAIYSMIRTRLPNCMIVVNGFDRPSHGDWDVCCYEDFSFDPDKKWGRWPGTLDPTLEHMLNAWPKRHTPETWRPMLWPYQGRQDLLPEWQDYQRLAITLVGEGHVANMDHSPQTGAFPNVPRGSVVVTYDDSHLLAAHRSMADWCAPEGRPSMAPSYTHVDPANLATARWGYALVSTTRPRTVYLHAIKNPKGKTGLPATQLSAGPFPMKVTGVRLMNEDRAVPFRQEGATLVINTRGITPDPVSTIFRVDLSAPMARRPFAAIPLDLPGRISARGNLAEGKPARLLSLDGSHELVPSGQTAWASNAVDGYAGTVAQGAYEWAWTLEVDLLKAQPVGRVKVLFGNTWPTHYQVAVSADRATWATVADGAGAKAAWRECRFAPQSARYVRVLGIKPDGENQEGGQMGVAELQVFAR